VITFTNTFRTCCIYTVAQTLMFKYRKIQRFLYKLTDYSTKGIIVKRHRYIKRDTKMCTIAHAHMYTIEHAHMYTIEHAHMYIIAHAHMYTIEHAHMHIIEHAHMYTIEHAHMYTIEHARSQFTTFYVVRIINWQANLRDLTQNISSAKLA
jgi:ribose 1,5-bisphosphokinase PhnN